MALLTTLSDRSGLLGGHQAPIGCTVAFIDRPCNVALSEIEAFRSDHQLEILGPLAFADALHELDPMEAPWTTELVADCGEWTAYINNSADGGDPSAIAPALARRMMATYVTAVHIPRYGPGHASTQFLLDGPSGEPPLMGVRSLAAHCADGQWSWHESGEVQPFEQSQRYEARLKRDRLDRQLLVDYLAALGIEADDSAFYGRAFVVRQHVEWQPRQQSASSFRRDNGWS